jgi:protocatechuate 3,4-dioxygenase beta subunit
MVPEPFTRRGLLRRAGAAGLAAAVGGSLGTFHDEDAFGGAARLVLTPEQEEGPFYVALDKIRKNITAGRPGIPLHLRVKVVTTAGTPIKKAALDIWHADAGGVYSDEAAQSTVGQTWLRGVQLTNAKGIGEFVTIYPGHYPGRTAHIHVKVHTGGHVSHTGQLMFNDDVTSKVYALAPYSANRAARTYNTHDQIYVNQGGSKVLLELTRLGASVSAGYLAAITLVVNPAAIR